MIRRTAVKDLSSTNFRNSRGDAMSDIANRRGAALIDLTVLSLASIDTATAELKVLAYDLLDDDWPDRFETIIDNLRDVFVKLEEVPSDA